MKSKLHRAQEILAAGQHSCVIITADHEPICSQGLGIKPLMVELRKNRQAFAQGVIADKVVGKAAALLAVLGGAQGVYGVVMSETAIKVFERHHVHYAYGALVPYIENRRRDGKCPMEQAVWEIDDVDVAFDTLEATIQEMMKR